MKTHEEIKTGLEYCSQNVPYPCNGCPYERDELLENAWRCNLNADTLAYIKRLEAQIPKWISVEERLPEVSDVVLVIANGKPREHITLHNALLIASYWGEEGWIADGFEGWDKLAVAHWMELPEAPKEG